MTTGRMLGVLDWEALYGRMKEADGRPLLENKSPLRHAIVEEHLAPCSYGGSRTRSGKPMNVDALKALARDFNAALSCTLEVRSAIVGNAQPSASLGELGAVALSFKAWPLLHAFCGGSVSQVPAIVAHTFKIHVGLLAAVNVLLEGVSSARASDMTVAAELLGTFIERRGVLVGARESCAAPPKLLARFLETVCHGSGDAAHDVNGAEPRVPDNLVRFAEMFGTVEAIVTLLDMKLANIVAYRANRTASEEARRSLDAARSSIVRRQRVRALEPFDDAAGLARALRSIVPRLDAQGIDCGDLLERIVRPSAVQHPDAREEYCAFEDAVLDRLSILQQRWTERWPKWASAPPSAADIAEIYGFDPRAPEWWAPSEPAREEPR